MSLDIVTGLTGTNHVTSAQDGRKNAFTFGDGRYVFGSGSKFAYELISNNLIKISDGDLIDQGRHICTEPNDYTELTIDNGISGNNRKDLIVMRYEKNADTSIESASLVVIKGTSTSGTASDPEYTVGDILTGELVDEFPLYRVNITGLSVTSVDKLFDVLPVGGVNGILSQTGTTSISAIGDGTITGAISKVNTNLGPLSSLTTTIKTSAVDAINSLSTALTTHKTSNEHDGRYYTETEINNKLSWASNSPGASDYGKSVTGYLRKFAAQEFCILGLNITTGKAITSAGTYEVAKVVSNLPVTITALSCRCITTAINAGIGAYIGSDGVIKITTSIAIPTNTTIAISGTYCF